MSAADWLGVVASICGGVVLVALTVAIVISLVRTTFRPTKPTFVDHDRFNPDRPRPVRIERENE